MVARYCSLARRMASKYIAKNTLPMVPTTVPVMPPPKPPKRGRDRRVAASASVGAERAGERIEPVQQDRDAKPLRQRLGGQRG